MISVRQIDSRCIDSADFKKSTRRRLSRRSNLQAWRFKRHVSNRRSNIAGNRWGKGRKDNARGRRSPNESEKKFHQTPERGWVVNVGEARRLVKSRADESWRFPDAWAPRSSPQCWEITRLYERARAWNISRGRETRPF